METTYLSDLDRSRLKSIARVLRKSINRGVSSKNSRSTMQADIKRLEAIEAKLMTNEHDRNTNSAGADTAVDKVLYA